MTTLHTFDADRGYHLFLSDAYEGGTSWQRPSSSTLGSAQLYRRDVQRDSEGRDVVVDAVTSTVPTYLQPWPAETELNFSRRRRLAVYINLCEPIVDAYADAVTSSVKRDLGPLDPYLASCDGEGQTWASLVGDVSRQVAIDGVCAVVVDQPERVAAGNRAEEVARGAGLRVTIVPVSSWAWMVLDDTGVCCEIAYASQATESTTAMHQDLRVYVWRADHDGTPGGWAVYAKRVQVGQSLADHRAAIIAATPMRSGPLAPGLGGRIPVVFAYHRRTRRKSAPAGRSIAAAPAGIGLQVYQLLSEIEDTARRAPGFLAVPTAARGGLEPETAAKVGPDQALPIPEGSGAPEWVTYPSESLAEKRAHVAYLVGLAYRVSGLEVQADQSAQVQSGEALRVRSRDFEARAMKLASDLRDFEARALAVASQVLGITAAPTIVYPQRFVLGDPSEVLAAATLLLQTLGDRLGARGVTEAMRQAIGAALSLDDGTLGEVVEEIEAKLNSSQPPAQKELFAYDYDAGVVTVNEVRATKGLGPIPGGDVTTLEWQTDHGAPAPTGGV
jgi:hypothetical protein